jgi:pyochelin synthetase
MIATRLLADLRQQNIQLWTEDDQLRVRAPRGVLTPELREQLALHKSDLLKLLRSQRDNRPRPMPEIIPDPARRYDPFPLTDIQQAYWVGRSNAFELGNVSCHVYYEVESEHLDLYRLNRALNTLIARHDMLRAIVLPDGSQKILQQVPPYKIEVLDLHEHDDESARSRLDALREQMSHQVLRADLWPLFELRASRLKGGRMRLHLSFDMLIIDVWSLNILFREWARLYENLSAALPPLELSFRDYVLAEGRIQGTEEYRRSHVYWLSRIATLPPAPELPLTADREALKHSRFVRRSARVEQQAWQNIKNRALESGLTPSSVLLAAFSEIINAWSKHPRFTINITLLNRPPLHSQINDILGDFTSLIPLEVDLSAGDTFAARASRLQSKLMEDIEHRFFNGIQVMREAARIRERSQAAAMPIVFTSLLTRLKGSESLAQTLWMGDVVYGISQTPQVWLDHQVYEHDGALVFNWDAAEALFPPGLLGEMFEAYCRLLDRLADGAAGWDDTSRRTVVADHLLRREAAAALEMPVPSGMLHTIFAEQAAARPTHPAIVAAERTVTYGELYRLANHFGRELRRLGARPNSLVAVVMEKGLEQVVATLAIMQSGAAYLPIDAKLPQERIHYLLDHGRVELALTQSWVEQKLVWPREVQAIRVDSVTPAADDGEALEIVQEPEDLAYVIYTSGSTGLPKGVMINHGAALNTICDINLRFDVGPGDRVVALSDLSFDLSVYDIFGTLAAGGTIVMPEAASMRDPARWAELVERENVTIWNSVPALAQMLIDYAEDRGDVIIDSLRLVLLSGDWIPVGLPDKIRALAPSARAISLGGATEASIWSILYPIERVEPEWRSIPYGRPMANQSFHVLNDDLEPCPTWVTGQLYIGGVGLAMGYWRDEEKTRAQFVHDPATGRRLYKTGDLGRYLPDSNIEFLGREDFQVKLHGYRVELGEIETTLAQHGAVKAAAARVILDSQESKQLVAYVVSDKESPATPGELKAFLKAKLPAYMVPSAFVFMQALPLTANGKVDRSALPVPGAASPEPPHNVAANATSLEERVASCFASVLRADHIDPNANILELGANSINIIKIANLLEEKFGFRPDVEEFYRKPSVAGLTEFYARALAQNQAPSAGAKGRRSSPADRFINQAVIVDPIEREEFKKKRPGLRPIDGCALQVKLSGARPADALREKYMARRSHRHFSKEPIALGRFGDFIACMRQIEIDGKPKSLHASAGGLYAVQLYIHVRPGRVEGLQGGVYYYDPSDHLLALVSPGAELDAYVHEPFINKPMFERAAFSIFLIAQLNAIAPLYGERSIHYATLEAGLITQLLEMTAPSNGLGLCQVGGVDFERVRHLFALEKSHVLIHSLLGGRIDDSSMSWTPMQESYCHFKDGRDCEEGEL